MFIHVTNARYCGEYKVWLSFNDGIEGEVDLAAELYGQVFEPLKDKEFFKSFELEGHTLSWSNGADFAPEFLYEQIVPNALIECFLLSGRVKAYNDAVALDVAAKIGAAFPKNQTTIS